MDSHLRICIVTSSYPLHPDDGEAAAGHFIRDLALAMGRAGVSVTVLTQARPGEAVDDAGIEVIRFPWSGSGKRLSGLNPASFSDALDVLSVMIGGQIALLRLLRRGRREGAGYDGVLAMWALPSGLWARVACFFCSVPYVTWTLGSDIWIYGKKALTRPILRSVLKKSRRVYADGEELRADTERLGGRSCDFLPTTRRLPRENLPDISLKPDKINFLFVGRFHPHKGPDLLLQAISLIPEDELAGLYFWIFGDGDLKDTLQAQAATLGLEQALSFGGYISAEVFAAYLQQVHALIIPSRLESIPVVLSDALQMDCPVVVTDVGDMGRLVREHGAGLVAATPEAPAISAEIRCMSKEPRGAFSGNIRSLYGLFDMDRISAQLIEDFREVSD